ncbi:MAG: hypothetical protein J1E39_06540 [Eubacterium sp.]|nr:hypothetical protein [Eubacterium sp.]
MFKKSKKVSTDSMSVKEKLALDKRPLKYVTERDAETYTERRLGENGAVNIMDGDFVLVCSGKDIMRCDIDKVHVGFLMNLSGMTVKGLDKNSGREMSVIAYFADKF